MALVTNICGVSLSGKQQQGEHCMSFLVFKHQEKGVPEGAEVNFHALVSFNYAVSLSVSDCLFDYSYFKSGEEKRKDFVPSGSKYSRDFNLLLKSLRIYKVKGESHG